MLLITTSNSEFIEKDKKLLVLHEGVKLYSKKAMWENINHRVLPPPINSSAEMEQAIRYTDKVYEKMLDCLASRFNELHQLDKDTHFYRIILGPWLQSFIGQLYEKTLAVQSALDEEPMLATCLLPKSEYYTPLDYDDYISKLLEDVEDRYALQIYSDILRALEVYFDEKMLANPLQSRTNYRRMPTVRRKFKRIATKIQYTINKIFHEDCLVIMDGGIEKLKFSYRSGFRFVQDEFLENPSLSVCFDPGLRDSLKFDLGDSTFEHILGDCIARHIPWAYLEGFGSLRKRVVAGSRPVSKIYYSNNIWYSNEYAKHFLADNHEKIVLCAHQHGGGYGVEYLASTEKIERDVADVYFTWGWTGEDALPLADAKLSRVEDSDQEKGAALLVLTNLCRYVYRLQFHPMGSLFLTSYLSSIETFIDASKNLGRLEILPQPQDFGIDVVARLREERCDLQVQTGRFRDLCKTARVVIVGHYATVFHESLAWNIPTIAFFPSITKFTEQAEPYIEKLRQVGILHSTPESAAQFLRGLDGRIEQWWQSIEVQQAREAFVYRYARISDDWERDWQNEFKRMLSEAPAMIKKKQQYCGADHL